MAVGAQIDLKGVAALWGSSRFEPALKAELEALSPTRLALDRCTSQGGMIGGPIAVSLLAHQADAATIRLRLAVLFAEIVGGCSCGDDPYQAQSAATLILEIDRASGLARIGPEDADTS
jgi:hypothetical protein